MVELSFHRNAIVRQSNEFERMSEKLEGIRILFIDDDYVNYLFFSEMLSDTGVIFYRAFTLTKTLEVLQEESCISLIVVSSAISRKTGYNIVRSIKKNYPSIPVITILDEKNPFIESANQEAGSDLFISRYVDKHNLIEAIEELMKYTTSH